MNHNYSKKITIPQNSGITKNYLIGALSILFALYAFERWTLFNSVSSDAIDGSWSIALNMIKQLNLQYGTDIVFTYGPLGYIGSTRLPIAVTGWQILLYDVWLILQGALVIWVILRKSFTVQNFIALFVVTSVLYNGMGGEPPFLYFYFVLFGFCNHLQTKKDIWLLNSMGIAVFTFFVKANVGLVCLGCFFLYITYYFIQYKPGKFWYITFSALGICSVIAGGYLFNVDLYGFIVGNIQTINSYNDVMRYYNDNGERIVLLAILIMGLYALSVLHVIWLYRGKITQRPIDFYVILFFSSLSLFILFKEGFVRSDSGHYALFFKYAFFPLSLLTVFISKPVLQREMALVALVVLGGQLVYGSRNFYVNHPKQLSHYAGDIMKPEYSMPDSIRRFPAQWSNALRRGTVDVIPYDIASIYLNGLSKNYRPRPVFQSYQVTNHFLDSLNVSFYQSSRAPEYIIYSHNSTDNRYPFGDEIGTRLTVLRYYDLFDGNLKEWLMLKHRTTPYKLDTLSRGQEDSQLGAAIGVPDSSGMQLMQIQVNYSLLGKAVRLFFQPPTLTLELETVDGKWHAYQASTTLLANGFIANKWIPDTIAFRDFMLSKGQNGVPVRRIRINTPRWAWALGPTIRVVRTQLSLQ